MTPQFHVDEIAIAVNWLGEFANYNGTEVLVIGGLMIRTATDINGMTFPSNAYKVETRDGLCVCCDRTHLRKRFEPGSWDELAKCGWKREQRA